MPKQIPIIDTNNEIDSNDNKERINISEGNIIFENVDFTYQSNPENKVLQK